MSRTLINGFTPDESHMTFSTVNKKQEQGNYFLSSRGKIRFFIEGEPYGGQVNLKYRIIDSFNKVS
jgi:hypothetical protein